MVNDQRARWRAAAAAIVVTALIGPAAAQSPAPRPADGQFFARSPQYPLLPRELEAELALSAALLESTSLTERLERAIGYTSAKP